MKLAIVLLMTVLTGCSSILTAPKDAHGCPFWMGYTCTKDINGERTICNCLKPAE